MKTHKVYQEAEIGGYFYPMIEYRDIFNGYYVPIAILCPHKRSKRRNLKRMLQEKWKNTYKRERNWESCEVP